MACSIHMAVWPADHMLQPVADSSVSFAADQLHGLQQIIVAVLAIASASYTLQRNAWKKSVLFDGTL
jgi:hypothetical protein